jgi:hypothetical protein
MSTPRKFAVLFLVLLALTGQALAAEPHHALVEIDLTVPGATEFIRQNGGRLDIAQVKPGSFAHIVAGPRDLEFLRASGQPLKIIQDDMERAYAYSEKGVGYGIYHTWSETVAFVDSLRLLYPEVISEKWSIGQTLEGRDIWAFRVSDNPDLDENEPEIFIDAMHHAREIMASEFTIMFAEYLAQGYGSDPEITWLLNNRELYIVPVVNPDGSVYNETNSPAGGGMWRKNRRPNGDGTYGVDPNRNYPYQWGYDDSGSSPDTIDETYRGPSAGSEPEVQALMNFVNSREFRTHDTIHSYSNLTLIPWGYTSSPTPAGAIFDHMADEMVKYNGYLPGQPFEAINYSVNGGTFDWVYGDLTDHDLIYSFSNEIGSSSDGFWPAESRREALFQENIWPHIYLMRVAGGFVSVHSPVVTSGARSISPGDTGTLSFTVENQSVFDGVSNLDITIKTDDPWVQLGSGFRTISSLGTLGTTDFTGDPIPLTVEAGCPNGHLVPLTVTVHMPEGDLTYPLSFTVGTPVQLFTDDMESGTGNWTTEGSWGLTASEAHSGSYSLTDSPGGSYPDQSSTAAYLNGSFKATGLSFWHRYGIESGYDYGRVQISADGGPWTTLGSYTGNSGWVQASFDLSEFAGQDISIRFVMETDYSVTDDGWYIDDVTLTGNPSVSLAMGTPQPISPSEGSSVGALPLFTVAPGTKQLVESVYYGFKVYSDQLCTDLVSSGANIPEGGATTSWTSPTLPDGSYWWRAWAGDGIERTPLSQPVGFTVNGVSAVGDAVINGPRLKVLGNVTGSASRFELSLPGQANVTVDIHDARGARIRQLFTGSMSGGSRVIVWDGRDSHGQAVASGVYFVRMDTGRESLTDRVVIVR